MDFDVIIPAAKEDFVLSIEHLNIINKYINPTRICVISNLSAKEEFDKRTDLPENACFIDENALLDGLSFGVIRDYLKQFGAEKRTGWYFQQFLKMAYAFVCTEDYYLSWDADTIPLRKLHFFDDEGKAIFSMKKEYNPAYFDTIKSLFDLEKSADASFIAEHMMFNCEIMKKLIADIPERYNDKWYLNILDSIEKKDIDKSGFSEFETYGTYVENYYPDRYCQKNIKAIRTGRRIFGECPSAEVLVWLGHYYATISFEKWDYQKIFITVYNHKIFRMLVHPFIFIKACNGFCRLKENLLKI